MGRQSVATKPLLFFTTSGCHLCEQAEQLLNTLNRQGELHWTSIDISSDPVLVELYGIRIPVIKNNDTEAELGWPFDLLTLSAFLENDSINEVH